MKYLPIAVVLVVLVVGTIIEGNYSDRWGKAQSYKLDQFTEAVNRVPKSFGHWTSVDDEINQKEFEASNCTNCISRTYTNREGEVVNVYLVSGTGRHVTIHTPDWCYVGAGYEIVDGEAQQYTDAKATNLEVPPEFLTAIFRKEDPINPTEHIRIFWTFSDDGIWRGPRMPKPTLGSKPAMYKIYMITNVHSGGADVATNPTLKFAREFLPIINGELFKAPPVETGTEGEATAASATETTG
ncbi:MAG: exosortase-associated EpsI family protein [Planctomycetaceae bacterium]|nr:exosortase-associated EpsI family protein [Planctomycetaceae bacterium]